MSDQDEDEVNDAEVFSTENVKVQEWVSKDRTVATIRMSDPDGMCDMKIYLAISAKKEQMEILMGIHAEDSNTH